MISRLIIQKRNHIRSQAIRDSADGETCCWPGCNVPAQCWAHSNLGTDGKGGKLKSSDLFGAYLCSDHHDGYDGRRKLYSYTGTHRDMQYDFDQAMKRSWERLIDKGIIKIQGEKR